MIYYVQRRDTREIKIGWSRNVPNRMTTLRAECGPIDLLAVTPGERAEEQALHRRFAWFSTRGEWFIANTALLAHIESIQSTMPVGAID